MKAKLILFFRSLFYDAVQWFRGMQCARTGHVMTPWEKDRKRNHGGRFQRWCQRCGETEGHTGSPRGYIKGQTVNLIWRRG